VLTGQTYQVQAKVPSALSLGAYRSTILHAKDLRRPTLADATRARSSLGPGNRAKSDEIESPAKKSTVPVRRSSRTGFVDFFRGRTPAAGPAPCQVDLSCV